MECLICGRPLRPDDVGTDVQPPPGRGRHHVPAHIACTKDGVLRWLRAGRPDAGPLEWDRREQLSWSWSSTTRRPWPVTTETDAWRRVYPWTRAPADADTSDRER